MVKGGLSLQFQRLLVVESLDSIWPVPAASRPDLHVAGYILVALVPHPHMSSELRHIRVSLNAAAHLFLYFSRGCAVVDIGLDRWIGGILAPGHFDCSGWGKDRGQFGEGDLVGKCAVEGGQMLWCFSFELEWSQHAMVLSN